MSKLIQFLHKRLCIIIVQLYNSQQQMVVMKQQSLQNAN